MNYLFNDKQSVFNSNRYYKRIQEKGIPIDKLKNDDYFSDYISLFFDRQSFFYNKGYALYLEGSEPPSRFDFVYSALNKKIFQYEPLLSVMDQCADFFELYDVDVQDRTSFVSKYYSIKAEDYIVPLFIILVELGNSFSYVNPQLFIYEGQIVLRFEKDSTKLFSILGLKTSKIYAFLVNNLLLEEKEKVDRILEFDFTYEQDERFMTIRKRLYQVKHFDKESRIIDYIKAKKIVSAQELAIYFGLSKRMINYYISDLINKGIVIREGNTNSSLAKYKINSGKYFF